MLSLSSDNIYAELELDFVYCVCSYHVLAYICHAMMGCLPKCAKTAGGRRRELLGGGAAVDLPAGRAADTETDARRQQCIAAMHSSSLNDTKQENSHLLI